MFHNLYNIYLKIFTTNQHIQQYITKNNIQNQLPIYLYQNHTYK